MKQTFSEISIIDQNLLKFQEMLSKLESYKQQSEQDVVAKRQKAELLYKQTIEHIDNQKKQVESTYAQTIANCKQKRVEIESQSKATLFNHEKQIKSNCDALVQKNKKIIAWIENAIAEMPPKLLRKVIDGPDISPSRVDKSLLEEMYNKIFDASFRAGVNRTFHIDGYNSKSTMIQDFLQKSISMKLYLENEIQATLARSSSETRNVIQRMQNDKQQEINRVDLLEKQATEKRKNTLILLDNEKSKALETKEKTSIDLEDLKKTREKDYFSKKNSITLQIDAFLKSDLIIHFFDRIRTRVQGTGATNADWTSYTPGNSRDTKFWIGDILVPVKTQSQQLLPLLKAKAPQIFNGTHFRVPLTLSAKTSQQIFVHYKPNYKNAACEFIQTFLLQKIRCNDLNRVEIYFADPNKSGQIMGPFSAPAQDNELIGVFNINSKDAIKNRLKILANDIDEINGLLGNCGSIFEYNESAKIPIKEKCLILNDVCGIIDKEDFELLKVIWNNAERCGMTIVMTSACSIDEIQNLYPHEKLDVKFMHSQHLCAIECTNDNHQIQQGNARFMFLMANLNEPRKLYVPVYRKAIENYMKVDNSFVTHSKPNGVKGASPYWSSFKENKIRLPILMHNRPGGEIYEYVIDSVSHAHTLITGSAGSGKTTLLHMIISSIIMNYHPDDVELWLVDYGKVSFKKYALKRPKHVRLLALEDTEEFTFSFLDYIEKEINRRARLYKQSNVESIGEYRRMHGELSLPRIVLIIDEFHLMTYHAKGEERYRKILENILQVYRKYGVSCIFSNQTANTGLRDVAQDQINNRIAMKQPLQGVKDTLDLLGENYTPETLRKMERMEGYGDAWCKFQKSENKNDFSLEYFKAIYPTDKDLEDILNASLARNDTITQDVTVHIIDGEEPQLLNPQRVSSIVDKTSLGNICFCLGVPTTIEPNFVFTLESKYEDNLLIAGRVSSVETRIDCDLLFNIIVSAAMNPTVKIKIFADPRESKLSNVRDCIDLFNIAERVFVYSEYDAICAEINDMRAKIKQRESQKSPTLNIWLGLRDLCDEFSNGLVSDSASDFTGETIHVSDESAEKALDDPELVALAEQFNISVEQMMYNLGTVQEESKAGEVEVSNNIYNATADIMDIFALGGKYSVFNVVFIENVSDKKRIKDFNLDYFTHKISYKLSIDDALAFDMDKKAYDINNDMLLYYDGKRTCTFRPFSTQTNNELIGE